jgi:hypothetical protein
MPWVGLEITIPASERAKTVHALDGSATVSDSWVKITCLWLECVLSDGVIIRHSYIPHCRLFSDRISIVWFDFFENQLKICYNTRIILKTYNMSGREVAENPYILVYKV